MITNDVSNYINLLVRISHIIRNHPTYCIFYTLIHSINVFLPRYYINSACQITVLD